MTEVARKYGWIRGLPSRRFPQLKLTSYPPLSPAKSLITTGFLPPIWDQGQTGSCTGHGTTRGIAYARAKQGLPYIDLSRLFPYWNARVAEGSSDSDSGATVGDAIAAAQQYGDCPYADLPTDPGLVTVAPSVQAFEDAITHKALAATRVMGSNQASLAYHFKHCIDILGLPVVIGIVVYESFESDAVAKTGAVPMPGSNEQQLGGHCIAAVAYDDSTQLITCDNSWGTSWGMQGRFTIPYGYVFDPDLADDFHAITLES
jgi:C1A family cysteine protease